jgi:dihydroflavonol-4-reductase
MRKALVTGAAGFIGSNVVRELLSEGVEVKALVQRGENMRNLEGLDVERVKGNVLDIESLRKAIRGCDTLFHLAAIYKFWTPDPRHLYEVNIRGGNYMLMAAREADVEKIVYTSSIGAIGIGEGELAATEETPFNWFEDKIDYILSKFLSEMNALDMAAFGLPLVAVNPAVPFGPGDITPTPSGKVIVDVVNGNFPGYIDAGFCVVDVRDVARGHVLAALKGRIGEKYILGNQNIHFKDFVERVARTAGVEIKLRKLPKPLMYAYGWASEQISNRFTHKEPVLTYAGARSTARYVYFDNTKARTELGLRFRLLDETLLDAIAWFQEIGMVKA